MKKSGYSNLQFLTTLLLVVLIFFGSASCTPGSNILDVDLTAQFVTRTQPLETPTKKYPSNLQPTHSPLPKDTTEPPVKRDDPNSSNVSELTVTESIISSETFKLCSPLESEEIEQLWEIISDPYNPPPPGRDERHHGVDLSYYRRGDRAGIEGEGIQAILPGFVASKVIDRLPYGNMVIIETPVDYLPVALRSKLKLGEGESLYHLYAHMKEAPLVDLRDEVICGQKIGIVGLTGYNIVNAHLHLETRIGPQGIIFDSMVYYDTSASQKEMENYRRWRTGGEFVHFDPMILFQFFLDFQK